MAKTRQAEKVTISAIVNVFDDFKNQMNSFLVHRYIKRKQQDHFTKLIEECDGSSAVHQVDFSENASIVNQNEIQSSHWSHQQVNISPVMYGLTKMSRRTMPLFLII